MRRPDHAARVTEPTGEASDFQPWRYRGGGRPEARRRELFALAAPVFRRHGYRGSTIKALAHACHLSPASLYHYFGSKEELATYLVRRPQLDWDSTWVDPATDPLVQLSQLLDLSLAELPNYLLAMRLADEIAGIAADEGSHARTFREGEAMYAKLVAAAAPTMTREEATRVARIWHHRAAELPVQHQPYRVRLCRWVTRRPCHVVGRRLDLAQGRQTQRCDIDRGKVKGPRRASDALRRPGDPADLSR